MRRHGQPGGQRLTVERPELTGGEPECLGLQGHVGDGLAEVPPPDVAAAAKWLLADPGFAGRAKCVPSKAYRSVILLHPASTLLAHGRHTRSRSCEHGRGWLTVCTASASSGFGHALAPFMKESRPAS